MADLDRIFGEIDDAKPMGGNFTPKLEPGRHKLVLSRYRLKDSAKADGPPVLEADFVVLESTTHKAREKRGWPWFIGIGGDGAKYQKERAQEFTTAVKACIGDTRPGKDVNRDMASPEQKGRGLVIVADVVQAFKNGQPLIGKKGPVYNVTWTSVPQSLADVAATRAQLDQMDRMEAAAAPTPAPAPVAPAPAPVAPPAAPPPSVLGATAPSGALGSILGGR